MKYIKLFENWIQESIFEGVTYPNANSITQVVQERLYTKLRTEGMEANELSKLWDDNLFKDIASFMQDIISKTPGSLFINAPFYKDSYIDYQDIVNEAWGANFAKGVIIKSGWESIKNNSDQDLLKSIKIMIKTGKVYELINGSHSVYSREEAKFLNALTLLNKPATSEQITKNKLTNAGDKMPPALLLYFKEQFEDESSSFWNPLKYQIKYSDEFIRKMGPKFRNIVNVTNDKAYNQQFWQYMYYYCSYYIAYYVYDYILTAMAECLFNLYKSMFATENIQINVPSNTTPNTSLPSNTTPKRVKSATPVAPTPSTSKDGTIYHYVSNT